MAELHSDEDFSYPVVEELRRLSHDVLTAREAGQVNLGIADSDVLAFALARSRAVLTFNRRDFLRLHRSVSIHRRIIICTRDDDVNGLALRTHQAISRCTSLDVQLLRITLPSIP